MIQEPDKKIISNPPDPYAAGNNPSQSLSIEL